MNILAIDPGSRPGYCWMQSPSVYVTSSSYKTLARLDFDAVVTENIWWSPDGRIDPRKIMKLSRTCGRQVQRACCGILPVYVLPVRVWKDLATYGGSRLPKRVFLQRVQQGLPRMSADELEAFWIGRVFYDLLRLGKVEQYLEKEPK